jgi:hypothetical protein
MYMSTENPPQTRAHHPPRPDPVVIPDPIRHPEKPTAGSHAKSPSPTENIMPHAKPQSSPRKPKMILAEGQRKRSSLRNPSDSEKGTSCFEVLGVSASPRKLVQLAVGRSRPQAEANRFLFWNRIDSEKETSVCSRS